jgi:hypothetical protein
MKKMIHEGRNWKMLAKGLLTRRSLIIPAIKTTVTNEGLTKRQPKVIDINPSTQDSQRKHTSHSTQIMCISTTYMVQCSGNSDAADSAKFSQQLSDAFKCCHFS